MTTLYAITSDFKEVQAQLEKMVLDGTIDMNTFIDTIEVHKMDLNDKLEATAKYTLYLDSIAKGIKAGREAQQAREKAILNRVKSMKEYITNSMKALDVKKIETSDLVLSLRKSEKVVIDKDAIIPRGYMIEKVTHTPDKALLKQLISNGDTFKGVAIEINQNLTIK